jgi:putative ABC transport system substrate-binding protein
MIGRRTVVGALGLGPVIAWAPAAGAKETAARPRIAMVEGGGSVSVIAEGHFFWGSLLSALRELGHVEGQSIAIERWAAAGVDNAGLASLAADVVATAPDLIVTTGRRLSAAFMAATTTIPIVVFGNLEALGLSLEPSGRNITGVNNRAFTMGVKSLQLMKEIVPGLTRIAWLTPRDNWDAPLIHVVRPGADQLGITVDPVLVNSPTSESTIRDAFASMASQGHSALYVASPPDLFDYPHLIAAEALALRLVSASAQREYAQAGILLSYSTGLDWVEGTRRLAGMIDRILDGADSAAMPIEQETTFGLVVNLKTAEALGLTLPPSILTMATEIIE